MPARVTVTLPEPVLESLDAIAQTQGVTRSDVVRQAAVSYITQRDRAAVLAERATAVEAGLAWLEQAALRVPAETPGSLDLLRELRVGGGEGEPLAEGGESR